MAQINSARGRLSLRIPASDYRDCGRRMDNQRIRSGESRPSLSADYDGQGRLLDLSARRERTRSALSALAAFTMAREFAERRGDYPVRLLAGERMGISCATQEQAQREADHGVEAAAVFPTIDQMSAAIQPSKVQPRSAFTRNISLLWATLRAVLMKVGTK